jgi:multidrug efflux pump subunit AcrB
LIGCTRYLAPIDIRTDWQNRTLKILIKVDQVRARRAGVSSNDIAQSLNAYFEGQRLLNFVKKIISFQFSSEQRMMKDSIWIG